MKPSSTPEAGRSGRNFLLRNGWAIVSLATCATLAAQTPPSEPSASSNPDDSEVLVLSPFVVDSSQDRGYQATNTLAGTRIRTDLADVGSSISVITSEMLDDLAAKNNETVLAYALNTEVGGPRGNFSGGVYSGTYREEHLFANPNGNTRVRGLTSADNTRNYVLSDIPWDGYPVDRVDLQRGPNAILFGLGSPAGVVNATTNAARLNDTGGSLDAVFDEHGSQRYAVDYNSVLIEDELALRIAGLRDHQDFQQKPAFQDDERYYAAVKYAPGAFNRPGTHFDISANYEHGKIRSNRPRQIPPRRLARAATGRFRDRKPQRRRVRPVAARQRLRPRGHPSVPGMGPGDRAALCELRRLRGEDRHRSLGVRFLPPAHRRAQQARVQRLGRL
jgi:outer membrane receptor protein involved in Fe transport